MDYTPNAFIVVDPSGGTGTMLEVSTLTKLPIFSKLIWTYHHVTKLRANTADQEFEEIKALIYTHVAVIRNKGWALSGICIMGGLGINAAHVISGLKQTNLTNITMIDFNPPSGFTVNGEVCLPAAASLIEELLKLEFENMINK